MNRRDFLNRIGIISTATLLGVEAAAQTSEKFEVMGTRTISFEPQYYHGWPTLTRRRNGQLVLVYSGGREQHVCPFGRVEMMVSADEGKSWGWPQILLDTPIDDRDAGVLETTRGTLLVTTFTSLAYEPVLERASKLKPGEPGAWPHERLESWQAAHNRLSAEQRHGALGQWMIRSTDNGITWSAAYPTIVNSPHGPTQLHDGRLLYAGVELWTGKRRVGVCESTDDGQTWRWLAQIPTRPSDDLSEYHELHAVEAGEGRILAHIRNHNKANEGETLQSESTDGGRSWTVPKSIGVWGLPSFLLRLRNGNLLMTYGHRRSPFGNQARLSVDNGRSWSTPMLISDDGTSGDLGYPSTVELKDGSLLTVWYESMNESVHAVIRQAHWRLKG
jgi:hypothetical protein